MFRRGVYFLTTHWSQFCPVAKRLQKQLPVSPSQGFPPGSVPRGLQLHAGIQSQSGPAAESDSSFTGCVCFPTFAAFGVVAEPVMSVSAAITALSLHVGFTAALTSNQASAHVCLSVAYSPVQRAHWVAVAGCRRNISTVRSSVWGRVIWDPLWGDSPSQMWGSLTSLSGCWK